MNVLVWRSEIGLERIYTFKGHLFTGTRNGNWCRLSRKCDLLDTQIKENIQKKKMPSAISPVAERLSKELRVDLWVSRYEDEEK